MDNKNLLTILNLFKDRPYHLSKFLLDNNAFTKEFLDRISKNKKLSSMDLIKMSEEKHFNNISEMKNYYNSLVGDLEKIRNDNSKENLEIEINKMLSEAVSSEDYEEAARLRDYMRINKIKKI